MKRRELKKMINTITECFIAECLATSLYGNGHHRSQACEQLPCLLHIQRDYISRISHVEPGMKASLYFCKLRNGLAKELGGIADQLEINHKIAS
ncbi:MAG: hypothetical protein K5928_06535 [Prevotella sp.]|nr:hypothetical protein [Prevotella sp.]